MTEIKCLVNDKVLLTFYDAKADLISIPLSTKLLSFNN